MRHLWVSIQALLMSIEKWKIKRADINCLIVEGRMFHLLQLHSLSANWVTLYASVHILGRLRRASSSSTSWYSMRPSSLMWKLNTHSRIWRFRICREGILGTAGGTYSPQKIEQSIKIKQIPHAGAPQKEGHHLTCLNSGKNVQGVGIQPNRSTKGGRVTVLPV